MGLRQTLSIEEIKYMLIARLGDVAAQYAPPAQGSYTDKHLYFTLNPGRVDRSVGSFCIHMTGPRAGHWCDFKTDPKGGDVFDLIGLSLGLHDVKDQLREARAFLGLQTDSPVDIARREAALAEARARRAQAERDAKIEAERRQHRAFGLWNAAEPRVAGTPVDHYLRGRGIDLAALAAPPRALRYMPRCTYHSEDRATGEVITFQGPAMLAAMTNLQGRVVAVHRTWLQIGSDGQWTKLHLPHPSKPGEFLKAKKVYGWGNGCAIRLSSGIGPRGGKGVGLNDCPPGTRVYIAEGIETALSARVLRPDARVMAAYSLSNLGQVALPDNVSEVVLIADGDTHPEAAAALQSAIDSHTAKGRAVFVWKSAVPGEDLNDALRRAQAEQVQQDRALTNTTPGKTTRNDHLLRAGA